MIYKNSIYRALEVISELCDILYKESSCDDCPFVTLCTTYVYCDSFAPVPWEDLHYPSEIKEHLNEYTDKIHKVLVDSGYYEQEG